MSSNMKGSPEELHSAREALCDHIEELAVKLVLSGPEPEEWATRLASIRSEAELLHLSDLAGIAADGLTAASASKAGELPAIYQNTVTRMQQIISGSPDEPSASAETVRGSSNSKQPRETPAFSEDRELLGDFIVESREHLVRVEMQMMTLEKDPADTEAVNTVFRGFHTIKGLAGFLELNDMQQVAHETETLLDLARTHKIVIQPAIVDVILAAADFLKLWLGRLEVSLSGGEVGPAPETAALLQRIHDCGSTPTHPEAAAEAVSSPAPVDGDRRKGPSADYKGPERRSGADRRGEPVESNVIKIDTAKLDFLVDMAGEMVIAQSMVRHHPELAALKSPALLRSLAQLERITGDLQKTAMSMRMVPIGGLFQKMTRLVRDLARKTGKQAEMESVGGETELDRNVVEQLADPLMHMVRNAADHGLEASEERIAAGKDPIGNIRLRACHQAGYIVVEIADDGRGLDREKILKKARQQGLIEEGANLSDREVFDLIFYPGFSTATEVTDVSGRGVGMDVVKKQVQKLRGHIEIESTPGKGTSFFLRLPLTLAMIDGLVVAVGSERYVVPIFSVREMLRPSASTVSTVEGKREMALVRNHLMPVLRLHERFGVQPRSYEPSDCLLVVAEAAGKQFCVMVDELIGKQEVVIKSLGESLKGIPGIAGGAILGDGRVGLILDLEGIFHGVTQ